MTRSNVEFSRSVARALQDRVGSVCAKPDCRRQTSGPALEPIDKAVSVGRACHIHAASLGGPRYDPSQSDDLRRSIENGIWLCAICSDLIDKNGGADYSAQTLLDWKRAAEEEARARLEQGNQIDPVWAKNFSALIYVNLPRLAQIALLKGIPTALPYMPSDEYLFNIDDLGGARATMAVENVIASLALRAVPLDDVIDASSDLTGLVVEFETIFHTKNGISWQHGRPSTPPSNWKNGPHIWTKLGKRRLVLPYDPRWITTGTAIATFRAGKRKLGGMALVKEGDPNEEVVLASPLLIGIPESAFDAFERESQP